MDGDGKIEKASEREKCDREQKRQKLKGNIDWPGIKKNRDKKEILTVRLKEDFEHARKVKANIS